MPLPPDGRSSRIERLCRLVLLCGVLVGWVGTSVAAQAPATLINLRQVRELTSAQAAMEQPIRLRGVVTAISGWKSSFFFQDDTAGVSVDPVGAVPDLQPGEVVEVVGVTLPGMFAPIVKATSVQIIGKGAMPRARSVGVPELSGGTLDSQWTTVQGVVHRAEIKSIWGHDTLVLAVDIGGGTMVTARVRDYRNESWHALPTSIISLQGVCGTVFNDRKQFIALRFFVPSLDDIKILHPGPKDPFDRPLTEIGGIGRFRPENNGLNLVRIRGVVTYLQGDGKAYIQNESGSVLVDINHEGGLKRGEEIEVAGYPRDGDYTPSLEGAAFRAIGSRPKAIVPVTLEARDVITEHDGFLTSPYDSSVIRVRGELRQVIHSTEETILFLQNGGTVFTARLPHPLTAHSVPAIGSVVEVTGICATRVDKSHDPLSFRLLLHAVSDIEVVQAAPWWSAEHAKSVVTVMAVALTVMMLILALYRREAGLRHLSYSDPLTGLHNRRGFTALAEQSWRVSLRQQTSMLMFYIDLNRFKEINDTLGHKQGDIALQTVADVLRSCFRKSDVIGRLGGDEFAVVVCNANARTQAELEARLAGFIEQANRKLGAFKLSFSTGVLLCDPSMSTHNVEDLLARADALMYQQKSESRGVSRLSSPTAVTV